VATEYSYVWIFEDGMDPQEIGNNLAVESVGDGTYSVEITTIPPCFSATGFFGVVTEECSLNIPNVITPVNGDALNNAFRVDGLENWPGSSVRIFNRWGNLVYTSSDFGSTAGWDPNLDEATEGTYWYELRINRGDDPVSIVQESIETDYPADGNAELLIHGSFALFR
jgi:gliding motility-associated-like protein